MHIKDFLTQNETRRKRPTGTNQPSRSPEEETKVLIALWKQTVSGVSYFSSPMAKPSSKTFQAVHKGFHILKEKGVSIDKYKPVFEGLVNMAKNPIGTVFISQFFRSGQGKISLAHMFIDQYKERSGMPLSWHCIQGMPIELALSNLPAFLETLKYSKAKASHIVKATQIEIDHMTKLGFMPNPELSGKLAQAHKSIWNVIEDLDEYDVKPESRDKALASFYRNFYDWSVDSLPRLCGESIFVNQVGHIQTDQLKDDHDFACSMFLLLYVEAALAAKFGRDNLPTIRLADMTDPKIKEKLTKLVGFRGNIFENTAS